MRLRSVTCAFASLALLALTCTPLACGGDDDGRPGPTPDSGPGDASSDAASDASQHDATADAGATDGESNDSAAHDAAADAGTNDADASDGSTHDAAADGSAQDAAADGAIDAGPTHFRWKNFVPTTTSEIKPAPDRGLVVEGDGLRFYGDTIGAVKVPVTALVTEQGFKAIPLAGNTPFGWIDELAHNVDGTFSTLLGNTGLGQTTYALAKWTADGSPAGVLPLPVVPGINSMDNVSDGRGTMFGAWHGTAGNVLAAYDAAGAQIFARPLTDGYPPRVVRADDGTIVTLVTSVDASTPIIIAGWSPDGTSLWSQSVSTSYASFELMTAGAFVGVTRNVPGGNRMFAVLSLTDGKYVGDFVEPDGVLALTPRGEFYSVDAHRALVKHDALGNPVWSEQIDEHMRDLAVKSDPNGNAYLFGVVDYPLAIQGVTNGIFVGAIGD